MLLAASRSHSSSLLVEGSSAFHFRKRSLGLLGGSKTSVLGCAKVLGPFWRTSTHLLQIQPPPWIAAVAASLVSPEYVYILCKSSGSSVTGQVATASRSWWCWRHHHLPWSLNQAPFWSIKLSATHNASVEQYQCDLLIRLDRALLPNSATEKQEHFQGGRYASGDLQSRFWSLGAVNDIHPLFLITVIWSVEERPRTY